MYNPALEKKMKYRELGKTGIKISEISFGAWAIGGPFGFPGRPIGWGPVDDEASLEALHKAFELGVNFVDTADIYGLGHSEEIVGQAIHDWGQEIFVASKVGFLRELKNGSIQDFSAAHIARSCEESLQRLGRNRLDLYQLHCVPMDVIRRGDAFGALEKLQQQGKIRAYGVSIITDEEALEAMKHSGLACVQIIYNILRQKPAKTVFPIAKRKKIGILARVPLASGLLTGKFHAESPFSESDHRSNPLAGETFSGVDFARGLACVDKLRPLASKENLSLVQLAIRWILDSSAVTAAIPGARYAQQVQDNVGAPGGSLSRSTLSRIKDIYTNDVAQLVESHY